MNVAIDYDDTYSLDHRTWDQVIYVLLQANHNVKFVTYRDDNWDNDDILSNAHRLGIEVVFTCGKQKANFYNADVWIDDNPVTIPTATSLGSMHKGCLVNNDTEEKFN